MAARTRPCTPRTSRKAERCRRILLEQWACGASEPQRRHAHTGSVRCRNCGRSYGAPNGPRQPLIPRTASPVATP